jgi:hypothetical protein
MKKVFIVCLLALGMNAAKAQCPINDILTNKDPLVIAGLIEANTDCLKQTLTQSPEYASVRVYVDYVFNTSAPWIFHTNLPKEKLFEDFYVTWGNAYPSVNSNQPDNQEFYDALKVMVATDPDYFVQKKETRIPVKYQQWLYVKGLNAKYGERNVTILAKAASKITNLPTANYTAFATN